MILKPNTSYLVKLLYETDEHRYTVVHNLIDTWIHATRQNTESTIDWDIDPANIIITKTTLVSFPINEWIASHMSVTELPFNLFETNPELFI